MFCRHVVVRQCVTVISCDVGDAEQRFVAGREVGTVILQRESQPRGFGFESCGTVAFDGWVVAEPYRDPCSRQVSLDAAEVGDRVRRRSAYVHLSAFGEVKVAGAVGEVCSRASDENDVVACIPEPAAASATVVDPYEWPQMRART